jgi:hypothetical protein
MLWFRRVARGICSNIQEFVQTPTCIRLVTSLLHVRSNEKDNMCVCGMCKKGFSFNPWTEKKTIAEAKLILNYLDATSKKFGIDQRIQFNTKVVKVLCCCNIK